MTYCCGILVRDGLVMIADTRTNAGIDNISTYRKLHMFNEPGKHILMIAAAGNLSATQSIMHLVSEGFENPQTQEVECITGCKSMFDAAQLIGRAIRRVYELEGAAYESGKVKFDVNFLFGGQFAGDAMRLFMIYSAGNFIECSQDAPYFQIGEYKYGSRCWIGRSLTTLTSTTGSRSRWCRWIPPCARTSASACPSTWPPAAATASPSRSTSASTTPNLISTICAIAGRRR